MNILLAACVLALGYFVLQHVDVSQQGRVACFEYHRELAVPDSSPWQSPRALEKHL